MVQVGLVFQSLDCYIDRESRQILTYTQPANNNSGHYDLLYKAEDIPAMPQPVTVPNYLVSELDYNESFYEHGASDVMTMLPGVSLVNPHGAWMTNGVYGEPTLTPSHTFMPAVQQQTSPVSAVPSAYSHVSPVHHIAASVHDYSPIGPTMSQTLTIGLPQDDKGVFRPSQWEYEPGFVNAGSPLEMDLRTAQFKK